ncbi:MAG TPA: hypothetical protein VGI89_11950, partial [Rhizomicrobium sp.]
GGRLNDSYGLPFDYFVGVAATGAFAWGWWPEINAFPWLTGKRRPFAIAIVIIFLIAGGWASYVFDRKSPEQIPRLRITDAGPVRLPVGDDIRINVHFINDGPDDVRAPLPHTGVASKSGSPLTAKEEDQIFEKLNTIGPDPKSTVVLGPGQPRLTTFPDDLSKPPPLTQKKLDELHKQNSVLYVMASIGYFAGKSNSVWHTEWCEYYDLRLPDEILKLAQPHICLGHNGVFGPSL